MITGNININEVQVDGPPAEAGTYLLWLQGDQGLIFASVEDDDLDDFEENYDGLVWLFHDHEVLAYCNKEYLELGYI